MSTQLFRNIVTDPNNRKETYKQFCLDAKRMVLVINGKEDTTDIPVKCIYTWLVNLFADEQVGLWFAYWCTQTALATIYQNKVLDINHCRSFGNNEPHTNTDTGFIYHLIDDGRQRVYICVSDDTDTDEYHTNHAELYIYKPFRVCYYTEQKNCMQTLFYYHLRVHISTHNLGHHDVKWMRCKTRTPLDVHVERMMQVHADERWVVLR
jgi:hypothetical protein